MFSPRPAPAQAAGPDKGIRRYHGLERRRLICHTTLWELGSWRAAGSWSKVSCERLGPSQLHRGLGSGPPSSRPFFARTARVPTLCDSDELSMCSVAPNISPRPPDPKTQPGEEANAIPAKRFCCCRCQWRALSMLPLLPLLARPSLSPAAGARWVSRALHPEASEVPPWGPEAACMRLRGVSRQARWPQEAWSIIWPTAEGTCPKSMATEAAT